MTNTIRQLTLAREYRGLSQSELASKIPGLSQPNLSKYEKGFGGLSPDILIKIMSTLDFPMSFLEKSADYEIKNAHYRKKSSVNKGTQRSLDTSLKLIGLIVDQMNESIDWPDFKLEPINLEDGYTASKAAKHTRKLLGLSLNEPVRNICDVLETHGIIIIEVDLNIDDFDGVSFLSKNATPIIVINKQKPNDRKRMTIAHELGHIIMHVSGNFLISDWRDKEAEAFEFAAEFLMPESGIFHSLVGLKFSSLIPLKSYWLTAMKAIIKRAQALKAITFSRARNLYIELSRRGMSKVEPVIVPIDVPNLYRAGYSLFRNELGYSLNQFLEAFSINIEILEKLIAPPKKAAPKVALKRANLRIV